MVTICDRLSKQNAEWIRESCITGKTRWIDAESFKATGMLASARQSHKKSRQPPYQMIALILLSYLDSNQERQIQNLQCYHYTIAQSCGANLRHISFRSKFFSKKITSFNTIESILHPIANHTIRSRTVENDGRQPEKTLQVPTKHNNQDPIA